VVVVFVRVTVWMFVVVVMMTVLMAVLMFMRVIAIMCEMDVKLHASDGRFLTARDVQMIAGELELFQFTFEFGGVHAEIEQRGDKHVAGNAAEEVEI